jgi:hypothetical protein
LQQHDGRKTNTWTKKRIGIIIAIAVGYGIWFNYLDTAVYCVPPEKPVPPTTPERLVRHDKPDCIAVGLVLGGNIKYQPWNIIGHCIPGLFLLLLMPKRLELFLAGVLISSAIMDSPLWGVMRLANGQHLWHMVPACYKYFCQEGVNYVQTSIDLKGLLDWTVYYYNPIGSYQVWQEAWFDHLPNAALIFWSVALRIIFAIILIVWQMRQEEEGKEFSLKKIILLSNYRSKRRKKMKNH